VVACQAVCGPHLIMGRTGYPVASSPMKRAAGLEQDVAAVRAVLTLPWSSGQAKGQITQLKLLKRSMDGRAGFDLLRRRILLTA
jgi:transposase